MKIIAKFLLVISLFLSLSVCAKEVKFIHITDIDLDIHNAYKLKRTIQELNSYKDVDFILFGGNNISKPTYENLNAFLQLIKKVNKKPYVLMGSKDVYASSGIDKKYYLKKVSRTKYRHSKKPNYTFSKKGYVFVVMDGAKQYFKSSNGYYGKEELFWLNKTLEKNKNKNVIILQHFPILNGASGWTSTAKTEEYWNVLAKHKNVKAIISGHYNKNVEIKKDGIYHIITENYSERGGYKIIEIDTEYDYIGTYLVRN